ncbi:hypothetical protein BH20ACI1_BH20ACI1_28540 [soil metagenome]
MLNEKSKNSFSFYVVLFAAAFGLNWIWEVSQTFAFNMNDVSGGKMLLFCTFASVIDGLVTIAVFWILHKIFADVNWKFYLSAAVLGALTAVFFEQTAFTFGLWSYEERMPVLPVLGTGLLPFMQLTMLVPLAIWLTTKLKRS